MYGRDYYGGRNVANRGYPRYPGAGFAGYPAAWGWGALMPMGFGGWGAYAPMGGYYGPDMAYPTPRRAPEESSTYGRGGDRALQRWARRGGYDAGYRIPPRMRGRSDRRPPRGYDAGWVR